MKYRILFFSALITALLAQSLQAIPMRMADEATAVNRPLDKKAAEHYYQRGLAFMSSGEIGMAKKAYLVSLENSPKNVNAMLGLAEVANKKGDTEEAASWINHAYEIAPDDPYVLTSHGRLSYTKGDFLAAERSFKKSLQLQPAMVRTVMALADMYATVLKKHVEAITLYNKVIKLEPKHAGAHYALGVVLLNTNQKAKAEQKLLTASKLSPDNLLPYYALANIATSAKKFDKALAYYDRIIYLDANNLQSLVRRGDIYRVLQKDELALSDYQAAVMINGKQPMVHMNIAMLQQKLGHYEQAKIAYLKVLEFAPDTVLAYNNLAWMAAENGSNLEQALTWAKKATHLAPQAAVVYDTLGWVYRAKQDHRSATTAFWRATQLDPKSATAYYHLGV